MSLSAEKEQKIERDVAGIKPRSAKSWANEFIMEFALMARKLRKGGDGAKDRYTPIIERTLGKYDAAIELLEENPQIAAKYGEDGSGIHGILAMLETKAGEIEYNEILGKHAQKVLELEPGHRINQLIRAGQVAGGLAPRGQAASSIPAGGQS